jgi:hypothetical protein
VISSRERAEKNKKAGIHMDSGPFGSDDDRIVKRGCGEAVLISDY